MHPRLDIGQFFQVNRHVVSYFFIYSAVQLRSGAGVRDVATHSVSTIILVSESGLEFFAIEAWNLEQVGSLAVLDRIVRTELLVAFD